MPETERFKQIHDGHLVYLQPEERKYVTPEAVRNGCSVGTPEEIIEHIKKLEASGIREIAPWSPKA